MRLLYLAWKHSGLDPYRLFNSLREDYRPLEDPAAEPLPPPHPERLRNVVYAFAAFAEREALERLQLQAGMGMGAR
jgi:hypothetical protein